MSDFNLENEEFRNHLYNQSKDGKRLWIYPGRIIGKFYRYRTYFSYFLLILLFGLPWLEVDKHPVFLFNVLERKFIFWGVPFFPQDFHLVAFGLVTFIIFISLFTVIFGRIWCGWACPQTIFMEMLFRKIEFWIEGDDKSQRRLDSAPWNSEKIIKKSTKHGLFFLLSFAIANTFLLYLIGKNEWLKLISEPPIQHITGLILILIFTAVFYFVFARFREMVCMVVCPYGRLQGVLLDNNSIQVNYDHQRGEPRGKLSQDKNTVGDCIDCAWCVRVCPTGIDIRNGSNQLECIGCTACIDACDQVMEKTHRPAGLIRYDSVNGILAGIKPKFTLRMGAYITVLIGLIGILGFLLFNRMNWEATLLRAPGQTFQIDEKKNEISNLYNLEILNKSYQDQTIQIYVQAPFTIQWVGTKMKNIKQEELVRGTFFLKINQDLVKRGQKVNIFIENDRGEKETIETRFISP